MKLGMKVMTIETMLTYNYQLLINNNKEVLQLFSWYIIIKTFHKFQGDKYCLYCLIKFSEIYRAEERQVHSWLSPGTWIEECYIVSLVLFIGKAVGTW
jgi:hypothetical protein